MLYFPTVHQSVCNRIRRIMIYLLIIICLHAVMPIKAMAMPPIKETKMFDISAPASELFREKALINNTVLQSIAFDHVNKHIYTAQLHGRRTATPK